MSVFAWALYYLGYAKGTALLPSSIAGVLSGSIPLFTFLATWLFLRGGHSVSVAIGENMQRVLLLVESPQNAISLKVRELRVEQPPIATDVAAVRLQARGFGW